MKMALTIACLLFVCAPIGAIVSIEGSGSAGTGPLDNERLGILEYQAKVNAPDFPQGLEWLNTSRPLSLHELRGKIVLLDFWTFCCINCMHVLPELKRLERKYKNELVVIGVHSAKFTTERETGNIRQAILRYGIEHPVINDREMAIWNAYIIKSWPTIMFIDPEGKVLGHVSGEGVYEPLDNLIPKVIEAFDAKGKIDRKPLKLKLEREKVPESVLDFPGKVLADQTGSRLFISDSNHNRIVILGLADHEVKVVIGSGEVGIKDGDFENSTFNHPQGMALDGNRLFVADTENHAIRLVDLDKRAVTTIAGTGQQAREFNKPGPGRDTALNSPWDLTIRGDSLYAAMAGAHQIWRVDLNSGQAAPYAGTGREGRKDGPLADAWLAQPSGLATDGNRLYVADSEDSSIRSVELSSSGQVDTIVGGDLFDFGDVDGRGLKARLQHPLGVAYGADSVYVADTYNSKIKVVSLKDRTSRTLLGTGEAGFRDGDHALFNEPGGLSIAGDTIYVADTNNHVIRMADLRTKRVQTLEIKGLDKLTARPTAVSVGEKVRLAAQAAAPGSASLEISLELPAGYKLNSRAPSVLKVSYGAMGGGRPESQDQIVRNPLFPVTIPLTVVEGESVVKAHFVIYYCQARRESLCYFKEAELTLPIKAEKESSGGSKLKATYRLEQ